MSYEGSGAPQERPTIVVADGLAARQWELHLAAAEIAAGSAAWATPEILPYAAWLESLWLAGEEPRSAPLTPGQSRALWRRVIAESSEADDLIGQTGVAEWAAAAWDLLHHWCIDPTAERAGVGQLDYRAFLGWCHAYRERLDAHGWIDRAALERGPPPRPRRRHRCGVQRADAARARNAVRRLRPVAVQSVIWFSGWRARCPRAARRPAADRIARAAGVRNGVQALRSRHHARAARARLGRTLAQRVDCGRPSGRCNTEPLGNPLDALI